VLGSQVQSEGQCIVIHTYKDPMVFEGWVLEGWSGQRKDFWGTGIPRDSGGHMACPRGQDSLEFIAIKFPLCWNTPVLA
jgi:hypothetical protein